MPAHSHRSSAPDDAFLQILPRIQAFAERRFRHHDTEAREELTAEAVALAFDMYRRLVERGTPELAYPTPLAACGGGGPLSHSSRWRTTIDVVRVRTWCRERRRQVMTDRSRKAASAIVMLAAIAGSGVAWWLEWPLLAVGIFGCCYAWVATQVFPKQRFWRTAFAGTFLVIGIPALLAGLQQLRCRYQPRPEPEQVMLFAGVEYIRDVLSAPRPAVIHILRIDLAEEGVEVLVTPPDFPEQEHPLRARTTSAFLKEYRLQAAINAANFSPFERRNPLAYLSFTCGDKSVLGGAASRGVAYGEPSPYYPILHIPEDNHAHILHEWPATPYTATAGIKHFIQDGQPIHLSEGEPDARTAVGLDETGRVLFLVVVDGDQAPYSAGVDRITLTEVLLRHGVYNALGLDGGGSSTMVIEGADGSPKLLNRPVQGTIPGLERPVGNHIGIYARRLVDAPAVH